MTAIEPHNGNGATQNPQQMGVVFSNMEEAWKFAGAVYDSGLAPKGMNRAGILVAIQMGAELGLPPMQAIQNIASINGRPSVWGDAIPAICMSSGVFDQSAYRETIERDESGFPTSATCTVRRLPHGALVTRTFTISDAKRAKLLNKAGPWSEYPARMLQMRARSWAMRDAFPDLLRGFSVADQMTGAMVDGPMVEQLPATATVEDVTPKSLDDLTAKMSKKRPPAPKVDTLEDFALTGDPEPERMREPGEDDEPFEEPPPKQRRGRR